MAGDGERAVDRAGGDDLGAGGLGEEVYRAVPGACAHAYFVPLARVGYLSLQIGKLTYFVLKKSWS